MQNDPNATVFMGQLVPALAVILGVISTVAGIVLSFRRRPPLAEEMYRDFATVKQLDQLRAEFNRTMAEIFDVQRQLKSGMDQNFKDLERGIGRIEGQLRNCPGPKLCEQIQAFFSRGQG